MAIRYRTSLAVIVVYLFSNSGFPQATKVTRYPIPQEEFAPYANARTIIEFSPDELSQRYSELKKLDFARDQERLPPLLQCTGEKLADFFSTFKNTSSVENVRQQLTDDMGNSRTLSSRYMYLLLVDSEKKNRIEESRADEKGNPLKLQGFERGFLLAGKLLGQLTFLLPHMQSESRFRYLGMTSNSKAHVIAFAQIPDHPSIVGTLYTLSGPKTLLYQGLVWIAPQSCQVLRMKSDLLAPRPDILLDRQTTDIEFREIRFSDGQTLWLPREVRMDALYMHIRFRNRHRYSDYKRFTVESKDEIKLPK